VLVPALLWIMGPARWHGLIAVGSATLYSAALAFWARNLLRERAEDSANPAVRADWRWSRRQSAASFEKQFRYFLLLGGWRTISAGIGARNRTEFVVQKDRWTIVLLFVGPGQEPASSADLDQLEATRSAIRATHAAIVTHARHDPAIAPAASVAHVQVLAFEDLARMDATLGLAL
jgi:hypothetical protein